MNQNKISATLLYDLGQMVPERNGIFSFPCTFHHVPKDRAWEDHQ